MANGVEQHQFCMNLLFLYVKIFPLQVEWENDIEISNSI